MLKWKLFKLQINNDDFNTGINMCKILIMINRYVNQLQKLQEKFEEHFVDTDKFRVAFQFVTYTFEFDVLILNQHKS